MLVSIGESNFTEEVIQASCPVLVSFWAPWCSLCRVVEPMLQQIQSTSAPMLKLVRINADENFNLTRHYNLKSIPSLLLFHDGELLSQLSLQGDRLNMHAALSDFVNHLPVSAR